MRKVTMPFQGNLRGLMPETSRIEVAGQDLLAAEGAADLRIRARMAQAEADRRAGRFGVPMASDRRDELDWEIRRTFERQRGGETGSAKFRKEDMVWPK
jgi:hypothetical protein